MTTSPRLKIALALLVACAALLLFVPSRQRPRPAVVFRPLAAPIELRSVPRELPLPSRESPMVLAEHPQSPDSTPRVQLVSSGEQPVADASVEYAMYETPANSHEVRTDSQGFAPLKLAPVGAYVVVNAHKVGFAETHAYIWATGTTVLNIQEGAEVTVSLRDEDRDLVGSDLLYDANGLLHSVRLETSKTVIGRFAGGRLVLLKVAGTFGPAATNSFALPTKGSVTVEYAPRRDCRVEFRSADRRLDRATYAVRSSGEGSGDRWESVLADGFPTVFLPAGSYAYLGTGEMVATTGTFSVASGARDIVVTPEPAPSVELIVGIPRTSSGTTCSLFVLAPNRSTMRDSYDAGTLPEGGLDYPTYRRSFPRGRRWPSSPVAQGSDVVWHAVPREALLLVLVETEEWGPLSKEIAVPGNVATVRATVERPLVVRVEASPPAGQALPALLTLSVVPSAESTPGPPPAACRMVEGRARVTGLAPDSPCQFTVSGGGLDGTLEARVEDGLEVLVPLQSGRWATRTARVVDLRGHPIQSARVNFQQPDVNGGIMCRTGPDGVAQASLPSGFHGRVTLTDDRFVYSSAVVNAEETVTLMARPAATLLVRNDGGPILAELDLLVGKLLKRTATQRLLSGGIVRFEHLELGEYRLLVKDVDRQKTIVDALVPFESPENNLVVLPKEVAK